MARTIYDKKCVYIQPVAIADYMTQLTGTPAVNELLAQGDITIDTKGELATFKTLNCSHYVDDENVQIRNTGVIKFSKNLTASFFKNHTDLAIAGIGAMKMDTPLAEITKGTGFPCTIDKTTGVVTLTGASAATNHGLLAQDQLVFIPGFGLRYVKTLSTSPNFTLDVTIDTAFTGSIYPMETFDLANPDGNKTKAFNLLIKNDDGAYIVAYGCNCAITFEITEDKQCIMSLSFTSPDISLVESGITPTITAETEGLPIIWNFENSYFNTEAGVETSYFPQSFTLGRTIEEEPLKYIGGRNGIQGYLNRATFKAMMKVDCDATGKTLTLTPRTVRGISFYSAVQGLGLYMCYTQQHSTGLSVANQKHDSYEVGLDINHNVKSRVLFGICK